MNEILINIIYRAALNVAAEREHVEIVKLLLTHEDIDVNILFKI